MNCIYEQKKDLFEILASLKDIDAQIFCVVIEILLKEKISDSLEFFSQYQNQNQYLQYIVQIKDLQILDQQQKLDIITQKIIEIISVLKQINEHEYNKSDYSTEIFKEQRISLINKIKEEDKIINVLKFLVQLTAIDKKLIQCGSNSLYLLVQIKVDLKNQCFEKIKIKNTSLTGGNFFRCNLSESEFNNVDISGINLNGALLLNCKWKDLKINELDKLEGHSDYVFSVCISPDGVTLASGGGVFQKSGDYSIRLWDIKTGQQRVKWEGYWDSVLSVCFSPNGATLASGSRDKSIHLLDVKTGQQKAKLNGHSGPVYSVCFSPDGTILASGSEDKSINLWDVRTRKKKPK